ncbi:HAEPLYID family protein [Riemerella anatipestifer]|uniref:HAEPLYID family protein n=1 Tax=Riemerella anatipestifer TaxID=34085 RepID=UPI0028580D3E|nr:HAEPLYID family protein [Riemerella anatipestifer]MDR7807641.1 HAEPLYID family protein [Riemerella anatipestifer]MDR7809871.1 HAEPLYID family protein [Riemerella anatipestifer]MDR7816352.1 HAEPLYID family protein [Riemerella anatipestifer]MDR7822190.1 HAEPLYID family protein [Riemerella anatipestifer]MDR7824518.1 HAEPLYID family protein [Riemerella anatipestifer]
MNFRRIILFVLGLVSAISFSQSINNEKDSLYIAEVEDIKEPAKVLHAEPLYIDLIRDLGARKGEKEWNLGFGLRDKLNFDAYEALVEYEWAPIDRLGLEVELPFTFYSPTGNERVQAPSSKLNSFKLALQWSFLVNEEKATTMALGYINELEFSDFGRFGRPLIKGNIYNPFFVVAKRWGNNFHTLVYTGPMIEQNFITNKFHMVYDVHSSFHYMISGTRNFVGVEFNKTFDRGNFDMVMRPQMRLGISEQLMLGVVVGIPVSRENERLSSFLRLIWEPKH